MPIDKKKVLLLEKQIPRLIGSLQWQCCELAGGSNRYSRFLTA